jgi:hypothetical protein
MNCGDSRLTDWCWFILEFRHWWIGGVTRWVTSHENTPPRAPRPSQIFMHWIQYAAFCVGILDDRRLRNAPPPEFNLGSKVSICSALFSTMAVTRIILTILALVPTVTGFPLFFVKSGKPKCVTVEVPKDTYLRIHYEAPGTLVSFTNCRLSAVASQVLTPFSMTRRYHYRQGRPRLRTDLHNLPEKANSYNLGWDFQTKWREASWPDGQIEEARKRKK